MAEQQVSAGSPSKKDAIRAELEQTNVDFNALLDATPTSVWKQPSKNKAWNKGQMLYHIASGVGFTAGGVENAKKGKGFNPPNFLANPINVLMTKRGAAKASPDSLRQTYAEGLSKTLSVLDSTREDQLQIGVKLFGQYTTIEQMFHGVKGHLDEHRADLA